MRVVAVLAHPPPHLVDDHRRDSLLPGRARAHVCAMAQVNQPHARRSGAATNRHLTSMVPTFALLVLPERTTCSEPLSHRSTGSLDRGEAVPHAATHDGALKVQSAAQ